jgi:hypothetical protein
MLKQELHGAFARFPSLSHTNLTMPEVSGLGKRKIEDTSQKEAVRLYFRTKPAKVPGSGPPERNDQQS